MSQTDFSLSGTIGHAETPLRRPLAARGDGAAVRQRRHEHVLAGCADAVCVGGKDRSRMAACLGMQVASGLSSGGTTQYCGLRSPEDRIGAYLPSL